MLRQLRFLKKKFPFNSSIKRLTLHTSLNCSKELTQIIHKLVSERNVLNQRIKTKLSSGPHLLFLKSSALESWKSKARLTLGIQRSQKNGGGYDWPLEELLNSLQAQNLEIPSAPILGFGYKRHRLGWIVEFFLITEELYPYVNGMDWLATKGNNPEDFIKSALELILRLNKKHFIHLDPWVANFMIAPNNPNDIRIIDLENCILKPTRYFQETLGVQFGVLFRRETCNYISEKNFDDLVMSAIGVDNTHYDDRFWQAYMVAKKEKIARKARRKAPLEGLLLPG